MLEEETVRAYSAAMERTRKLDPALLKMIYEQGWFKLFVPEELGGRMTALPEALLIFEEASRLDGNLGWLVTIGSGGGMFAAYLPPDTARSLFTPKEALVAGSGHPSGIARKAEGGYSVTGAWKYCSGASYATLFTANCRVVEGAGEPDEEPDEGSPIRAFAFLPDQVEIVEDWKAFGLKATESNTMKVERVFVPEERTFELADQMGFHDLPIYRYPFLPFAETSFAAVTLGLSRHFLDEAGALAERSKIAWEASNTRRYAYVMDKLSQLEAKWTAARETFYRIVRESWGRVMKGGALDEQEQQQVGRISKQTARTVVKCAHELFPYLGMHAAMEDSPVNRIWRDLHTVSQHILLVPFEDNEDHDEP